MHYAYETSTPGASSWIKNVHKVTNLEANYAAQFTEVHVTIPKQPGDKAHWPGLPHITIVTVKNYRYHWYILGKKISEDRRMEQIGTGNKSKNTSWTSLEMALVKQVLLDVNEKSWC